MLYLLPQHVMQYRAVVPRRGGIDDQHVIGNENCRIFRNQEYSVFGNNEYIGFGNKGAEKMATRNAEICQINTPGNGTNPLFIKAYDLS